ncbi:hypothetical protein F503_06254 [Ophiostoma piceae UAMH 11346]|uniref:Uncharacterized protein n=1 Tax=Ophiostoma piceae (strain UAMH 11346) TaxID=1262450 RepID=S3CVD6_OPHP1|nr:hypothetical protein F503_06254 [Ophiostoma piceae UAMH 11346]
MADLDQDAHKAIAARKSTWSLGPCVCDVFPQYVEPTGRKAAPETSLALNASRLLDAQSLPRCRHMTGVVDSRANATGGEEARLPYLSRHIYTPVQRSYLFVCLEDILE